MSRPRLPTLGRGRAGRRSAGRRRTARRNVAALMPGSCATCADRPLLQHHPHRPLDQLRRVLPWPRHDSRFSLPRAHSAWLESLHFPRGGSASDTRSNTPTRNKKTVAIAFLAGSRQGVRLRVGIARDSPPLRAAIRSLAILASHGEKNTAELAFVRACRQTPPPYCLGLTQAVCARVRRCELG